MQNQTLTERVPDEILMRRVKLRLKKGPASVAVLCLATNREPKDVRAALTDLMEFGVVKEHADERQYELASGGYCPDGWPGPQGAA